MNRLDYSGVKPDWHDALATFFSTQTGQNLAAFIKSREEAGAVIYPAHPFRALELTALTQTRVIIVGQDPYHGPGQAQGLSFHVAAECKIPPSLRNIHKELQRDLGIARPQTGELTGWAQQGVLLLNAVLTVEEGKAASHAKKGWEVLTDTLLGLVAQDNSPKVFMLWGAYAQSKESLIAATGLNHLVLKSNHPSPLSATKPPVPFIGCGHFSKANLWLTKQGLQPIHWNLFSDSEPAQNSFSF